MRHLAVPPALLAAAACQHVEVAPTPWQDPRVGSAANCQACHTRAEAGSYGERELRIPGGRRHEHD